MNTAQHPEVINPDKLAQLDTLTLDYGSHGDFYEGHCAMEVVSWLADLCHADDPSCVSPVLRNCTIALNDSWDIEKRQSLKPFLPRLVGTGGDGKDDARRMIAARYTADKLLGPWLRLAGLNAEADALVAVDGTDYKALQSVITSAATAAQSLRQHRRKELTAKVSAELAKHGTVAAVATDAVAIVASAVDAAVASAIAADAASAIAAAVATDAVAIVVAAVDVVVDAAVVAAVASIAESTPSEQWSDVHQERPLPISKEIADLAASQEGAALELLELMIDPDEIAA